MSEETLTGCCESKKPENTKHNYAYVALAIAIGLCLVMQVRLIRKHEALDKRVTAVENMFAK